MHLTAMVSGVNELSDFTVPGAVNLSANEMRL